MEAGALASLARRPGESVVLLAGLWVMMCAGLHYSFATFSEDLRLRLGLDQRGLDVLATGKDLGAYFGVVQGLFHDRFGARPTVLIGATVQLLGYGGLFALTGEGRHPPLWQPFLLLFLSANGAGWVDMGVLMTLLHNSGAERAMASGVAKALLGLGASVFSLIYVVFLKPDARDYLLLCGLAPFAVVCCALPFLERLPREDLHQAKRSPARAARLWCLGAWVCVLCVYNFLCNAFLQNEPSQHVRVGATLGLLALLTLPPMGLLSLGMRLGSSVGVVGVDSEALLQPAEVERSDSPDGDAAESDATTTAPATPPRLRGQRSSELTVGACLRCTEFWLLFWALAAGAGGALVLVNNLAQLGASIGSTAGAETLVALFSVCNAAGRLGMGAVGTLSTLPRPAFLVCALVVMTTVQLGLTEATPGRLHLAVAVAGLSFGSLWSFAPVVVGELFGERHAGAIYGCLGTSPAVGSFLLNTLVAGRVYDAHSRPSPPAPPGAPPSGPRCVGGACFRLSFQICTLACAAGTVSALILFKRTRHVYKRDAPPASSR